MARGIRPPAAEEIGSVAGEAADAGFGLTLKPAELEALIDRLCACGTRRAQSTRPRRAARRCAARVGTEWCRLGERAAATVDYVDTRFG